MKPSSVTLLLFMICGLAHTTLAGDRLLLVGGEIADESYYSYTGVVLPLRELGAGRRLVQRYWLDRYGYQYDGGPGRIDADAWGGEAALGCVAFGSTGWIEASLAARYTDTDLDPDDPGAEARGSQLGLKMQLQGERRFAGEWRFGAIASYASRQNEYWSRLRLTHPLTARLSAGAELVAGGNDESDSFATGIVLLLQPGAENWSVGLRLGHRHEDDAESAYAGIELGRGF